MFIYLYIKKGTLSADKLNLNLFILYKLIENYLFLIFNRIF